MTRLILFTFMALGACAAVGADSAVPPKETADCYVPVEGGWQIRITERPGGAALEAGLRHRRGRGRSAAASAARSIRPPTDRWCGPRRNLPSASESLSAHDPGGQRAAVRDRSGFGRRAERASAPRPFAWTTGRASGSISSATWTCATLTGGWSTRSAMRHFPACACD